MDQLMKEKKEAEFDCIYGRPAQHYKRKDRFFSEFDPLRELFGRKCLYGRTGIKIQFLIPIKI